jgi:hypothetical protein
MSLSDGTIVVRVADNGRPVVSGGASRGGNALSEVYPDLSDPATLGAVLGLVREAWQDPKAYVICFRSTNQWTVTLVCESTSDQLWFDGATEAEALVCALEAAP